MKEINVLMVCMGNICRSPLAHGLFEHLVEQEGLSDRIRVDSAGTHAYHVGEQPDPRSQETALRRGGIDLSQQRARKVRAEDFERFDYVLAMDAENYHNLQRICPTGYDDRLSLFLDFASERDEREVPDPYYGGAEGFERVYEMVDEAARGLLQDIRKRHL